jgi:Zn-dependent peptidase ImmA (M78 family)
MEPRIGFAREMARKYLKKHRITAPPVPVEAIIAAEGIHLQTMAYPDGTAGESWREHGVGFIAVSTYLRANRRRFTLAHEFGHLVLRHHENRFRDISYVDQPMRDPEEDVWEPSDPLEVEANQFAAELLMPLSLFKKEWQANPDAKLLAARYQVSQEAAWWRIRGFPMR